MAKIKVMDELLANKIAAGEVVEKCASVVKELVENSIDADAHEIKVELKDSGVLMIKVTDDGVGMDSIDALACFYRHATSKIIEEEDLYHINTLGFRGEALASIASVSKVDLKTSQGDVGTHIVISGGKVLVNEASEARKGTIMTVTELFYNTPARLKHLRSLTTELSNIIDYMNKLALAHPEIKFTLKNNDNVILSTSGDSNLLKVIGNVYGMNIVKKMEYVAGENDDYVVKGYISLPEITRGTRNVMTIIVNGRVVRNQEILKTINDSYHSYKHETRYPIVVLNIKLDPSLVDVNIHPTKMDIKFSKFEELKSLIQDLILKRLRALTLIPEVKEEVKYEKNDFNYEEMVLNIDRLWNETKKENLVDFKEKETIVPSKDEVKLTLKKEEKKELPMLYPVGVVHGTYIICENEKGMYLIDQHAAKERINYEKFKFEMGHPAKNAIMPIFPYVIELTANEAIIAKERLNILTDIGFDITEIGINSLVIKAHPTWLIKDYEEKQIRKIVEILIETKDFSIEKFRESVAITLSCKMAIKANEHISKEEVQGLLDELRMCNNPFNCPHGRPTIIFYTNYELEKLFKRTGFEM